MESRNYSTCFVVPWYGEYPLWMKYFLMSIENNPEFNWLLVSEEKPIETLPGNCSFLELSTNQLEEVILDSIGIQPQIYHPYKLCDFKPAYGEIFSDYLVGYDYWGYCDLDVVFGNLSKLLGPFYELQFDIFSPDAEFFPGHFCLFRNSENISLLYRKAKNYKQVLGSENCYLFDEFIYSEGINPTTENISEEISWKIRRHKKLSRLKGMPGMNLFRPIYKLFSKYRKSDSLKDFNSVIQSLRETSDYRIIQKKLYLSDIDFHVGNKKNWTVTWVDGDLNYEKELLYFHFQLSKASPQFSFEETENGFSLKLS